MPPNISVIIPCHNRAHMVGRALDSVLAQTTPAQEIIVVDDGSSDDIREVVMKNYPGVRLLHQRHLGVSAARNLGIREAGGDWIALLDSDDAWLPQKLELQYRAFLENEDYRIGHTNEIWIRNGQPLRQLEKHKKTGGYIFRRCLPLCLISPSSVMIHRQIFSAVGLFDEQLPVCEDYDMWLRICCRFRVLFLEQALIIKHGGHEDQLSRQYWGMDRFRIQSLVKLLDQEILNEVDRQAAIDMLLRKIEIFMKGARKHGNNQFIEQYMLLNERFTREMEELHSCPGNV